MRAQRWIAHRILAHGRPHWASYAYAPRSSIKEAASLHCGCVWLIKLNVHRFFKSISEIAAHRVFLDLGYQPLVAFEFARLCTRQSQAWPAHRHRQWRAGTSFHGAIPAYQQHLIGHLPQGAPTSPMLSTLAMVALDEKVAVIAKQYGLFYTRYADDICLSTPNIRFGRSDSAKVIAKIYKIMAQFGLSPTKSKLRYVHPEAEKSFWVYSLMVRTAPHAGISGEHQASHPLLTPRRCRSGTPCRKARFHLRARITQSR